MISTKTQSECILLFAQTIIANFMKDVMTNYDIIAEAIQVDAPKEFVLKLLSYSREKEESFLKKEITLKKEVVQALNSACRIIMNGVEDKENNNYEEDMLNNNIKDSSSIISDNAEYSVKEISELLSINYKTCARIFRQKSISVLKRGKKGNIYLGKTIKEALQSSN